MPINYCLTAWKTAEGSRHPFIFKQTKINKIKQNLQISSRRGGYKWYNLRETQNIKHKRITPNCFWSEQLKSVKKIQYQIQIKRIVL